MIAVMPRPRPPYLLYEKTRHGSMVWYVRIGKGPRTRLLAPYGTKAFNAEYRAALDGLPVDGARKQSGTLAWLVDEYRVSSAWNTLKPATRRQRENIFVHVLETSGAIPFKAITHKVIVNGRERRQATPNQANNFIKAMSGLFKWAVKAEHVTADPTATVEWIDTKSEGFHTWTEKEITKFEAKWPLGTRERLAFDVLLYTGLRRGDAVRLGPANVHDGIFSIVTEKTGIEISAPILPPLQSSIDKVSIKGETFICKLNGKPWVKEAFGTWFREVCDKAGVPGSAHGLRKAGATRAAENGATEKQIEAIFGWSGGKMAAHYTRKADRKRMAKEAMHTISGKAKPEP